MEKKMHILVQKPIKFMVQEETGFIGSDDYFFAYDGGSLETMKIYLYIREHATIINFESEGTIPIEKTGEGLEGKDFFIDIPKNIHCSFIHVSEVAKQDFFLPRVEIDFTVPTKDEVEKMRTNYSNLDFLTLIAFIWAIIESTDYRSQKQKATNLITYIPTSLEKYMKGCDDEALSSFKKQWEGYLEKEEDEAPDGDRKKIAVVIYKSVIDLIKKEEERRQKEMYKRNDREKMTIEELNDELEKAIESQDFEDAVKIRDLIANLKTIDK